jgi:hypothetical protein
MNDAHFFEKSEFVNQTTRRHIPVDREVKVMIYTTAIIGLRRVKSQNRDVWVRGMIFNSDPCVDCHIPVVPNLVFNARTFRYSNLKTTVKTEEDAPFHGQFTLSH